MVNKNRMLAVARGRVVIAEVKLQDEGDPIPLRVLTPIIPSSKAKGILHTVLARHEVDMRFARILPPERVPVGIPWVGARA